MAYQPEEPKFPSGYSMRLTSGDRVSVDNDIFHKVLTIGQKPAFYMYTFFNSTEVDDMKETPKLPVLRELYIRLFKFTSFVGVMLQNLFQLFFISLSKCYYLCSIN